MSQTEVKHEGHRYVIPYDSDSRITFPSDGDSMTSTYLYGELTSTIPVLLLLLHEKTSPRCDS